MRGRYAFILIEDKELAWVRGYGNISSGGGVTVPSQA